MQGTVDELPQKDVRRRGKLISAITIAACLTGAIYYLSGSHLISSVIVYDQAWSRLAGIEGMGCSQELREDCRKEAISDEATFANQLSAAFASAPECKGFEFHIDSQDGKASSDERLAQAKRGIYWRLRADFRPRLPHQYVYFATQPRDRGGSGEIQGDAAYVINRVCYMVRRNGIDYWW
jgi:hypothetical protein